MAPSEPLVKQALAAETDAQWRVFVRRYRAELKAPERSRVLDLLAALSHGTAFSIGCYCEREARCHRSILRQALEERGAAMA